MTYVYTILANDVVIPKFDPETEEWPDIEVQGGQVEEVKLIRQILHEMSRITKLRKMIAEMEIWDAFKKEDLPPEDEDKEKNLDVVFAGAADDPNNPFPHIDDTEVEVATKRAEEAEGNVRYEASQGWQASLGEKKRLKFIDTKIAEFEKELLVAPTEELRVAYQEKIDVLRRKRLHESIDDLRYAKSNLEHRMIHGLQEPSYSDFIEHAQQTTTLDVRIKSRERRLELTAESPLALGDGSGTSKGGALQLTRVKDVKLYDDETVEAAKKSEDYIQMKQTMEAILNEKKNPYKEFKGTKEEFNQVGDDKFSETVTPQAKLLAYAKGWDLFTQQEKEQMQNMNVWPPETIQWNQIKKRYEKKNQDE